LSKSIHNFFLAKIRPNVWTASVIFIKLPKVNHRLKGENSPNLVTLLEWQRLNRGSEL
jgi:hypothetical protein